MFVKVNQEKVRESPNGKAFGNLHKNEKIYVMGRSGNWILFHNNRFDSVFVWGPSVGFEYINIYNPQTYFTTSTGQFYHLSYLEQLLGTKGKITEKNDGHYQVFFDNLGLGSHDEIIMESVNESTENVRHGITFDVCKSNDQIDQVKIDYLKPIKGLQMALGKSILKEIEPSTKNEAVVIWKAGTLINGLTITLEREEWNSSFFSAISFKK